MTTLSITPKPETGSHQLTIEPTGDVTRIQRTDRNGSYDVRVITGLLPWPASNGTLVLDDYEAADGTSTYTVTTTADAVGGTGTLVMDGTVWLGLPVTPQFSAKVNTMTGYDAGLTSRNTVLEPDGSPNPIVIIRTSTSRAGTLKLWAGTYEAALALLRLCGRGQIIFLRQPDHKGMDMFFTATGAQLSTLRTDGPNSVFGVDVGYIEVPRPRGPLSGALGWTWGELKNTYATWGDVFNAYATWGDLRTNTVRTT
jgi:hypothetical protein